MPNFKLSSNALFCLLIMPCLAHGLDLGKVDVYSGLHENLNGKIALQLSPEDLKKSRFSVFFHRVNPQQNITMKGP